MIELISLAGAVSMLLASATTAGPSGETIAEHGTTGAGACSSCHGAHYEGDPAGTVPALAGLSADVILARLNHYASPAGKNPAMHQVATALDPAERAAVAAYISNLPKPPPGQ
jgi:cytochrome c553